VQLKIESNFEGNDHLPYIVSNMWIGPSKLSSKFAQTQIALPIFCNPIPRCLDYQMRNWCRNPVLFFCFGITNCKYVISCLQYITLAICNSYKMHVQYRITKLSFSFQLGFSEPSHNNTYELYIYILSLHFRFLKWH